MIRPPCITFVALLTAVALVDCTGCGTTRSTDTTRTATEQLLISDAIDRAVQSMNLQTLAGQTVYLDDSKLTDTVDKNYFISTLRQQLLASGCELRDKREEADFVVEARAGAIGTDRNDLLFGLPSMNVPQIPLVQPVPAAIPEIPIAKRKDQRGIAKIAVFAYHRATGTPVWQSGIVRQESSANDVWIFGTGPFQRGTIYEGTAFAGSAIGSDPSKSNSTPHRLPAISVSQESTFTSPKKFAKKDSANAEQRVSLAAHQEIGAKASNSTMATAAAASPIPGQPAAVANGKPAAVLPPVATSTPQPTTPAAAASAGTRSGTAAKTTAPNPALAESAYAHAGDKTPLPQPRFNSPK